MNLSEQQRLMRAGKVAELEKKISALEVSIQTSASVVTTALFTTGEIEQIDIQTAQSEFDQLKSKIAEYKRAKAELKGLKGGDDT